MGRMGEVQTQESCTRRRAFCNNNLLRAFLSVYSSLPYLIAGYIYFFLTARVCLKAQGNGMRVSLSGEHVCRDVWPGQSLISQSS